MKEKCAFCNQELPPRQFKAGDFVQTVYGTTAIVLDPILNAILDARYGALTPNTIRLLGFNGGYTFVARRDELTVLHGFFRITERL